MFFPQVGIPCLTHVWRRLVSRRLSMTMLGKVFLAHLMKKVTTSRETCGKHVNFFAVFEPGLGPRERRILLTDNFSFGCIISGSPEMPHFRLELRYQPTKGQQGHSNTEQISTISWTTWGFDNTSHPRPDSLQLDVLYTFSSGLANVRFRCVARPARVAAYFERQEWMQKDPSVPTVVSWEWSSHEPARSHRQFNIAGMSATDVELANAWESIVWEIGSVELHVQWHPAMTESLRYFLEMPSPTPPPFVYYNRVLIRYRPHMMPPKASPHSTITASRRKTLWPSTVIIKTALSVGPSRH